MGLDLVLVRVDRDAPRARWSYSGFNAFRKRLCAEVGVDLDQMFGFGGDVEWSTVKDDLVPLLDHSDCDGDLGYSDCVKVHPRLLAIVAEWPDDYDRQMALTFCRMMKEVVDEEAEAVLFQ